MVSTQLWIPCGGNDPDAAIYVFQGRARRWELVLATDSDFDPTGGADETGLQYKISPPDSRGKWFLAVAELPPSCSRIGNVLRYKVLRPGGSADKPIVLMNGRDVVEREFEPRFRLEVHEDWFAVTEGRARKLDKGLGVSIFRFEISKNNVRRIAPLALTPENFLDQWTQLSWDDAKRWSNESSRGDLERWQSRLSSLATDSVDLDFVQQCSKNDEGDGAWLVGLSIDRQANPAMREGKLYADVAKKNGTFSIEAIGAVHPPGCPGKTRVAFAEEGELPTW